MISNIKVFSLLFSIFLISINCQSQIYSIDFYNGLTGKLNYYHIQINRDSKNARISLIKTIKVNYNRLKKDKQLKILIDSFPSQQSIANPEVFLKEFERIINKYIRSKKDEINVLLQDYPDYFALIDSIYICDSDILLNEDKNKNRIVLDGTTLHMKVISDNIERKNLSFHSPSAESHPIIDKVIKSTIKLYKEKTGKDFLNKIN